MGVDLILTNPLQLGWELGGIVLVLLALFVLRNPESGMAFLCTIFFVLNGIHLPRSTLMNYMALLVIVSLMRYVFIRRNQKLLDYLIREPLVWLVITYTGWKLLTYFALSASDPYSLGNRIIRLDLVTGIIPFLGIMIIARDRQRVHRFIGWMCVGIGLASVLFVISYIDVSYINQYPEQYWRSLVNVFGYAALSFGTYALVGVILGTVWLATSPRKSLGHRVSLVFILISILLVMLGGSRATVFLFPIVYGYCLWALHKLEKRSMKWIIVIAIVVLLIIAAIPGGNEVVSVLSTRFQTTISDWVGSSTRFDVFSYAFGRFLESPLTGVGTGGGGPVFAGNPIWLSSSSTYGILYRVGVHNFYLQVLSEQGLIGSTLMAFILVRTLSLARRTKRSTKILRHYDLYIISTSILIFSLLASIVGGPILLYPAIAILWVANSWSKDEQKRMYSRPLKTVYAYEGSLTINRD